MQLAYVKRVGEHVGLNSKDASMRKKTSRLHGPLGEDSAERMTWTRVRTESVEKRVEPSTNDMTYTSAHKGALWLARQQKIRGRTD